MHPLRRQGGHLMACYEGRYHLWTPVWVPDGKWRRLRCLRCQIKKWKR